MEMEKVPQLGYEIKGLDITGLQRSLSLKNLAFPFKLLKSLMQASRILDKFCPEVVIGTGGFASGPTLFMASVKGVPSLIQEQNSYPGITNRLLAKRAKRICVAYDGLEKYFPADKLLKTGNPVRQDLLDIDEKRAEALKHYGLDPEKRTLVVLGGSLGARVINQTVEKHLDELHRENVQLVWQTGKLYYEEYRKHRERKGVLVREFIQRMDLLYAAADILVSRAGAGTISELCIVGKPVIFIPSPNVAEDHQTKNALALADRQAAIMLREEEIDKLPAVFAELLSDAGLQKELSVNIKKLALPDATKRIADEVENIVK
jgi:UDP-N-acetylglucosamine--N-acetylmuramyl-(pentapeptide) pyrophosphoryl-undecaprenol N-acetylglucosamine transferase